MTSTTVFPNSGGSQLSWRSCLQVSVALRMRPSALVDTVFPLSHHQIAVQKLAALVTCGKGLFAFLSVVRIDECVMDGLPLSRRFLGNRV